MYMVFGDLNILLCCPTSLRFSLFLQRGDVLLNSYVALAISGLSIPETTGPLCVQAGYQATNWKGSK